MFVKQCEWISKDALEAMLTIGDAETQCVAFCHPCHMNVGDMLLEPVLAISIKNVAKMESGSQPYVLRIDDGLVHEILAEVVSVEKSLVVAGEITIELDDVLPGDINVGDMISFSCGRLDVIS
ncbi:hypothetical protein [Pseudomonas syringae]|uniref:hypothetical protein n=1 Tax=Pseudomonas syringae TaxID=317 RepID=UPI0009B42675|nr:hypothetical protein [Pseudomonas syringae]PBP35505.1 hypothetical protein CCL11_25205 [Pseudomonas syringae]PBP47442.1 hypothetical protein CCL11_09370 [Pseudomonas syringae]RXT64456.1 hypothetical protein B1F74_11005 [Pseudomonas syringae]